MDFISRFGEEAHSLAWTAEQLFGVHPEHGTIRIDFCGALMTGGNQVLAVEADRLVFERGSAYRNKPGQTWGVPVWQFVAKGD